MELLSPYWIWFRDNILPIYFLGIPFAVLAELSCDVYRLYLNAFSKLPYNVRVTGAMYNSETGMPRSERDLPAGPFFLLLKYPLLGLLSWLWAGWFVIAMSYQFWQYLNWSSERRAARSRVFNEELSKSEALKSLSCWLGLDDDDFLFLFVHNDEDESILDDEAA